MTKRRTVTFLTLLIIILGISACGSRTEDPDGGTGDGADTQAAQRNKPRRHNRQIQRLQIRPLPQKVKWRKRR